MGDAVSQTQPTDNPGADHLQKMHRRRISVFGLVILTAGVAIGGASVLILAPGKVMPPPPSFFDRMFAPLFRSMEQELNLSQEQQDKLRPIIKNHMEKLGEIHSRVRAEINKQWTQMNEQILAVLTEEQQEIWKRKLEEIQRRFHRSPRGGPRRGDGQPGPYRRRGEGESGRFRGAPGPFAPGRRPEDQNRPRMGAGRDGRLGRQYRMPDPRDPNRPRMRMGLGRGPIPQHPGRRPGVLGPGPHPEDVNLPAVKSE